MNMQMTHIAHRKYTSTVTPRFLLRVGGLPMNAVSELRFEQTMHWQETVFSLEGQLLQRKEHLVDVLHNAVKMHTENQALRRKLINLKRDIFNMRLPGNTNEFHHLTNALLPEDGVLLEEWLGIWDTYQQTLACGTDILLQELCQQRQSLKKWIETPDFRAGILLSSQVLDAAIDSYLASDNRRLNREARTVERSLLEYLQRTACKTSPFSTFTPVCLGMFSRVADGDTDKTQDITLQIAEMDKRSFVRLNMLILARLTSQILASPEVKRDIPVKVTTGWHWQNGRIKYVRRRPTMDGTGEEALSVLDIMHENVIQLPAGQLLRDLILLMGDGHEIKIGEIIAHLCATPRYMNAEDEVEQYLQHLLRLGFLVVPGLQPNIHSEQPLAEYRKVLRTIATTLMNTLADNLGEVELLINAYATSPLAMRRKLLLEIKQKVQHCGAALRGAQTPFTLPHTLLYEDTILTPQQLLISEKSWEATLSHVAQLQHLLPIFDTMLPQKLVMRGYFLVRYGAGQQCDDFLSFADAFNQDFIEVAEGGAGNMPTFNGEGKLNRRENHFGLSELDQLDDAQQAIADYINRAYASLPKDGKELILNEDFYKTIAACVPEHMGSIQSHTFFSQFARINGEALLIVNQIYSGLTLMFSRFAYCFAGDVQAPVVSALRTTLQELQPPGVVFAEMKGGYEATNLNLHPIVTPYELVCPGELSTRPVDEQIPLDDIIIRDDERGGRLCLYSKRLGKEVIPLYLGFLTPLLLPELQKVLLSFSYTTVCPLHLWNGVRVQGTPDGFVSYPRLRYKNIVVQRARWKIPYTMFPQHEPGQSDADFYLTIVRWRTARGLPARVFLTPDIFFTATTTENETNDKPGLRLEKPLYVDFENYFSVMLLEATVRKLKSQLVMTEMLPDTDHLWFEHKGQSYVSEFVFEMNSIREADNE